MEGRDRGKKTRETLVESAPDPGIGSKGIGSKGIARKAIAFRGIARKGIAFRGIARKEIARKEIVPWEIAQEEIAQEEIDLGRIVGPRGIGTSLRGTGTGPPKGRETGGRDGVREGGRTERPRWEGAPRDDRGGQRGPSDSRSGNRKQGNGNAPQNDRAGRDRASNQPSGDRPRSDWTGHSANREDRAPRRFDGGQNPPNRDNFPNRDSRPSPRNDRSSEGNGFSRPGNRDSNSYGRDRGFNDRGRQESVRNVAADIPLDGPLEFPNFGGRARPGFEPSPSERRNDHRSPVSRTQRTGEGSRQTDTGRSVNRPRPLAPEPVIAPDAVDSDGSERLHVRIAHSGLCSRRAAEKLIAEGRVQVNGEFIRVAGTKVESDDEVRVDGIAVTPARIYTVVVNKPTGVVTTLRDPQGRPTIVQFLPEYGVQLKPVGRLDMDTDGLLICTNDGELATRLMHPRYGVEKEYMAIVQGIPDDRSLDKLREGVHIEGGRTSPARVEVIHAEAKTDTTSLRITIHEGRKRQVRLMCEAVGHPVKGLRRTRLGSLTVRGMRPGEARLLGKREVDTLRESVGLEPLAQ